MATLTTLFFVPIVYSILRRRDSVATEEDIEIDRYSADEEDVRLHRLREAQAAAERAELESDTAPHPAGRGVV